MYFRDLLVMLQTEYGKSSFRVIDARPKLMTLAGRFPIVFAELITNPKHLMVKSLSNDMRRLHSMGFLKRKREKRPSSKSFLVGEPNYRGFQYIYSISKNGLNYLDYLGMKGYKPMAVKLSGQRVSENEDVMLDPVSAFNNIRKRQGFDARFSVSKECARLVSVLDQHKARIAQLEGENARLQLENIRLNTWINNWTSRWKQGANP